jgi:hypothetical protein
LELRHWFWIQVGNPDPNRIQEGQNGRKKGGGEGKNPSSKAEELSEGQAASPEAKPECLF